MSFLTTLRNAVGKLLPDARQERKDQVISISDAGPVPELQFRVDSTIERYRTQQFGGERRALVTFLSYLQPHDVVFDIGASVGLFALAAAKLVHEGHVYAFEPDAATCNRLAENVALNNMDNLSLLRWALGAQDGIATLYTDGCDGFAPTLRFQSGREGAPSGREEVEIRTLDAVLGRAGLPLPTVLKIDVEGAEAECLQGAGQLLAGDFGPPPRVVFVEIHPAFLPLFESSPDEVYQRMEVAGYYPAWRARREAQEHICYVRSQTRGVP